MKKSFTYSSIFISSGVLTFLIAGSLDAFWAKVTLGILGTLMGFVGLFLLIKEPLDKKKSGKVSLQNNEKSIYIKVKKISSLILPLFSSMLSLVSILVLFLFFSIDKIEMWKVYLIAIAIVQAVIMIISSVKVVRYLNKKTTGDN